jgi:quinol monooxygenase YgiN
MNQIDDPFEQLQPLPRLAQPGADHHTIIMLSGQRRCGDSFGRVAEIDQTAIRIIAAFWEVNSGEESAVAALLKDFLPQAQREPGVKEFQIHQNVTKPREFFFYEVFAGEAAFAEHQQTDHFKNIIVGQAIPKLARRERQQFRFI